MKRLVDVNVWLALLVRQHEHHAVALRWFEGLAASERNKIRLTAAGLALAEQVVRRHRLAERFLTDILGLSWADAHREAGRWEGLHGVAFSGSGLLTAQRGQACVEPLVRRHHPHVRGGRLGDDARDLAGARIPTR